jgi:hypothetical protein
VSLDNEKSLLISMLHIDKDLNGLEADVSFPEDTNRLEDVE